MDTIGTKEMRKITTDITRWNTEQHGETGYERKRLAEIRKQQNINVEGEVDTFSYLGNIITRNGKMK